MPSQPDPDILKEAKERAKKGRRTEIWVRAKEKKPWIQIQVTPPFEVPVGINALRITTKISGKVEEGMWMGIGISLVDLERRLSRDFSIESHFHYSDPEPGHLQEQIIGGLESGRYVLRIDPRWTTTKETSREKPPSVTLKVFALRPSWLSTSFGYWLCICGWVLILLPLIWEWGRKRSFEKKRWSESYIHET